MAYHFDRYVDGRLMAEGAYIIVASSEADAMEKARELFAPDAVPGEMDRTKFVLRNRAHEQRANKTEDRDGLS